MKTNEDKCPECGTELMDDGCETYCPECGYVWDEDNQNEADDYVDEGVEMDRIDQEECDEMNEQYLVDDETPLGQEYGGE